MAIHRYTCEPLASLDSENPKNIIRGSKSGDVIDDLTLVQYGLI